MGRVVNTLRATGFRKGVLGSSRGWFGLWAVISAARFLRKRLGDQTVVVDRIVLGPGQSVEIRDTRVTWGELKKAAKAEKVGARR